MPDKASNEKQNLDWEDQQNQRVQVPTGLSFPPDEISGSLKKERKIQWGSELRIGLVFKWSKTVCSSNDLLFEPCLE